MNLLNMKMKEIWTLWEFAELNIVGLLMSKHALVFPVRQADIIADVTGEAL